MTMKHSDPRMLRLLWLTGLCIFFLIGLITPANALDQANVQTRTSLWSVQAEGGKVYLLGSVHFLRQSDYPLPVAMERAYADCDRVVFETNIGAMASPEIQQQMIQLRIEGHEVSQIAERTQRSKRSVERVLQKLRQRLSDLIDDANDSEPSHE